MPEGEDMSLTDPEKRELLEFAIGRVNGRVPVIAHVSDAGTALAVARAIHAEKAGAAAIVSHPPYFWHPKPAMVVEHLTQIGRAVGLPLFVFNPPVESAGTPLTSETALELVERLPNLAGVVDSSFDWVFMAEVISNGAADPAGVSAPPRRRVHRLGDGPGRGRGLFAALRHRPPARPQPLRTLRAGEVRRGAAASGEDRGA